MICFFKGLCLVFLPNVPGAMFIFLPNVPGATFIQGGTFIPESRVKHELKMAIFGQILKSFGNSMSDTTISSKLI